MEMLQNGTITRFMDAFADETEKTVNGVVGDFEEVDVDALVDNMLKGKGEVIEDNGFMNVPDNFDLPFES